MKRSFELLIADQLQQGGFMKDIRDAIQHMTSKRYSYYVYETSESKHYIVTVVVNQFILIIYSIDYVDESVKLITTVGIQ